MLTKYDEDHKTQNPRRHEPFVLPGRLGYDLDLVKVEEVEQGVDGGGEEGEQTKLFPHF